MRTLTCTGAVPPTRSISRSCSARSSLACRRMLHLADLVEQQGAAVGRLELADAAGEGAGEGALLVAEQFRFQQVLGDRGTVQGDERARRRGGSGGGCAAPAPPCRCRFAGDQHRGVRARDLLGAAHRGGHGRVAHDQRVGLAARRPPGWRRSGRGRAAAAGTRARRRGSRAPRRPASALTAAGHHRHGDALRRQRRDQRADVVRQRRTARGRTARRRAAAPVPPPTSSAWSSFAPRAIAMRAAWPSSPQASR